MSENTQSRVFGRCLGCLVAPAREDLAARLTQVTGLRAEERDVILEGAHNALLSTLSRKLTRLLVLELNAARVEGRLDGATPEDRWDDFVAGSATPAFWNSIQHTYPTLAVRLSKVTARRVNAAVLFARDWAADRDMLGPVAGHSVGSLTGLSFGRGDSHAGGRTVATVETAGGPIVYKPRSLAVDAKLADFLDWLGEDGSTLSLRVGQTLDCGEHGWARFVPHRFAADDADLASFYRGIGEALAVMRVLGGTDLHAENLIACAGAPVLIDCETLFTPHLAAFPSPYGLGHDQAAALVAESVLAIGLLPDRGQGLGWRGIDMSGVGGLPDQQREVLVPGLVDAGTDRARVELVPSRASRARNHPTETPRLADFWPQVLIGFDDVTARLRNRDAERRLEPALARFADCRTRVVVRPTETYAELTRMLWHPVSLADEDAATERAREVLAAMARTFSYAPSMADVIAAEIDDLLADDIPVFTTTPGSGALSGPHGVRWLPSCDLIAATLAAWRKADVAAERTFIRSALVSAYVNDGYLGDGTSPLPSTVRRDALDVRRRRQAAKILGRLIDAAHLGADGTVSWAAPTLQPSGWTVTPLGPDLYAGLSGIAVFVGGYVAETRAGRADPVKGTEDLLRRLRHTLHLWEAEQRRERIDTLDVRPPTVGGYVGLGSQIWARLALRRIGMDDDRAIADALAIAEGMRWADAGDDHNDVLYGRSGAIPPLLHLAEASGDSAPLDIARHFGYALCDAAQHGAAGTSWWVHRHFPQGMGGFAHGATGVGWALARLAAVTDEPRFSEIAARAFAFEDSLWDEADHNWRDLRDLPGIRSSVAWCHGAVGIALARMDLDPALAKPQTGAALDHAVARTLARGIGSNHCLCHGDFGAWELLSHAIRLGRMPRGLDGKMLLAGLITSLEDHGPVCGVTRDAFHPGLFTGLSGIAYQLLRAHPDAHLPSPLVLG